MCVYAAAEAKAGVQGKVAIILASGQAVGILESENHKKVHHALFSPVRSTTELAHLLLRRDACVFRLSDMLMVSPIGRFRCSMVACGKLWAGTKTKLVLATEPPLIRHQIRAR